MSSKRIFAFLFCFGVFAFFAQTDADSKSDLLIKQSGLNCRVPVIAPWNRMPALFGFGTSLYQESKKDDRVTFGLVVTPLSGDQLEAEGLDAEIKEFHKAKKEFVEELGGEFLGASDSLKGQGTGKLYRASVDYRLDDTEYRDSTYFRFIAGRLIHAKVIFPLKGFAEKTVEQQTTDLLAGMTCETSAK